MQANVRIGKVIRQVDAHIVGHLAYLPVPDGTVMHRHYPDAWIIVDSASGDCVSSWPTPADEQTARATVEHLLAHPHGDPGHLIDQFAKEQGKWFDTPVYEEASDG